MAHTRPLRDRVAGQSAMSAVVDAQATVEKRTLRERFFGVSPLVPESRASYRAALGELFVGDVLENLGPSWDVLHDLPLGSSVLDHLLIGRAGVFIVRTVNYGREDVIVDGQDLIVGGSRHRDVGCAILQAGEAAGLLGSAAGEAVRVRPLLVVVDPRRLSVRVPSSGARVITSRGLEAFLANAPVTLAGDEVARVSDLADQMSTWPVADATDLDTQQLYRDFGSIRSEVGEALARRVAWAALATVVAYTTVCGLVAMFVSIVVRS